MTTKTLLLLAAFTAFQAPGQQAATPQPAQHNAAANTNTPCNSAPSKPHTQGWLEKKARALACAKNPNACNLPASPDDALGTTLGAKPCTPATAPKTQAPAVTPAPAKPVSPPPPPTADYVCPPKATLIPGQPYCIFSDRKVVDAIPLPSGTLADPSKSTQPNQHN